MKSLNRILAAPICAVALFATATLAQQPSSGTYTTLLGEQSIGTEDYKVTSDAGGSRRSEAEVSFVSAKFKAILVTAANGRPASYVMEVAGKRALEVEFGVQPARIKIEGQPERQLSASSDVVLENGAWHHFVNLLALYDATRAGAQTFRALLPSQAREFAITLQRTGARVFEINGRKISTEHYRASTDLGLEFEIWADAVGTPLIISIPAQGARVVRKGSEEMAAVVFPRPAPKPTPSASDPFATEEITFNNGEQKLAGTFTTPKSSAAPYPAALIISGSGAQDRDGTAAAGLYRAIAERLSASGVAVLRVDDRGAGQSSMPTKPPSYQDLVADSRAGLEYLLNRREVDKARIALIGHSEGAGTAAIIASEDARVAAIVLLAGTSRPVDDVLIEQSLLAVSLTEPVNPSDTSKLPPLARQLVDLFQEARTKRDPAGAGPDRLAWFREHLALDPLATVRRVRVPVLIVNGERDYLVMPHHAIALGRALADGGNKNVMLRILPNLTHLFTSMAEKGATPVKQGEVSEALLDVVQKWATETLPRKSK